MRHAESYRLYRSQRFDRMKKQGSGPRRAAKLEDLLPVFLPEIRLERLRDRQPAPWQGRGARRTVRASALHRSAFCRFPSRRVARGKGVNGGPIMRRSQPEWSSSERLCLHRVGDEELENLQSDGPRFLDRLRASASSCTVLALTRRSPMSAIPVNPRERLAIVKQGLLAGIMGLLIVWLAGFAPNSVLHNAAHDTRHSHGFPCH